ncbi:Armadillo repeat-containing protein 1 [Mactra antiquata]
MVSCEAIQAMKAMAMDRKKGSILVKDSTCIGGLVLVLSNSDTNIVRLALETIQLLAENETNRPVLRNFIGMMDQLETLVDSKSCGEVENIAKEVYLMLKEDGQTTPLRDTMNNSNTCTSRRSSMQKMLHGGIKNSKLIVLQLKGLLNKFDRDVCMRLLLQVKGVISITFDMNKKRCIVRTKLDVRPENLVVTIAKTQSIHAQQVVKDDSGRELFLSFGLHDDNLNKENMTELPDYLPDDEELQPVDDKAITRNKSDSKSGGWLSTAANFLANSFYW